MRTQFGCRREIVLLGEHICSLSITLFYLSVHFICNKIYMYGKNATIMLHFTNIYYLIRQLRNNKLWNTRSKDLKYKLKALESEKYFHLNLITTIF